MGSIEMFVSLKAPDSTAITAFETLKRMGYLELADLERSECYKLEFSGDENKFKQEIANVDILVNANKHKVSFSSGGDYNNKTKNDEKSGNKISNSNERIINILVQDIDNGSGWLSTLKERLGLDNIRKIEKGVLWTMHFNENANAKKIASDITKNLLMNENYQTFRILR